MSVRECVKEGAGEASGTPWKWRWEDADLLSNSCWKKETFDSLQELWKKGSVEIIYLLTLEIIGVCVSC